MEKNSGVLGVVMVKGFLGVDLVGLKPPNISYPPPTLCVGVRTGVVTGGLLKACPLNILEGEAPHIT